jgi:hypothetical protein
VTRPIHPVLPTLQTGVCAQAAEFRMGEEDKVECGIVENNKTKAKTNWKGIGSSVYK